MSPNLLVIYAIVMSS